MIRRYLLAAVAFVGLCWVAVAILPFVLAWCVAPSDGEDVRRLTQVLGQSGTFGDTFGSVNALFSGLALIALVYTLHLQQQEIAKVERDRKEAAFLDALSSLCNVYATIYSGNPDACDKEFDGGRPTILTRGGHEEQGYTVKGKLLEYAGRLAHNLDRIKSGKQIEFPPPSD